MQTLENLPAWEKLLKKIVFEQLSNVTGLKILDFGSGNGETASFLAKNNDVTAIEPWEEMIEDRCMENTYVQLKGSLELLSQFEDSSFDMVICHNVMEYVDEKEAYFKEFSRILKTGGRLSIIKHNRAGRVMQNVVLLDNFEHAKVLLAGGNSEASKFGAIRYYKDCDIESWCPCLKMQSCKGIRAFWDLQQNQDKHKEPDWQDKMVEIERMVEDIEEYKAIAFFHHLLFRKY